MNRSEKKCRRCKQVKPAAEFRSNPKLQDGLHSWCRSCSAAANRAWRDKVRNTYNAARRRAPLAPRKCQGCGVMYQPVRCDQKHCTKACGKRALDKGRRR